MTMQSTITDVQPVIDAILKVLGEPQNTWDHYAMDAFNCGDLEVKITAATNLNNYYCYCLGFLVNAKNPNPKLQSSLKAAAKAAAKHAEQRTLDELSDRFSAAFGSSDPSREGVQAVLDVLISDDEWQKKALDDFRAKDYQMIRDLLKIEDSSHSFYKALVYLSNASNSSPSLPMILAEAAYPAAEHVRIQTQKLLEKQIAIAFPE